MYEPWTTLERAPVFDAREPSEFARPFFGELKRVVSRDTLVARSVKGHANRPAELVARRLLGENEVRRRTHDREVGGIAIGADEVPAPAEIEPSAFHEPEDRPGRLGERPLARAVR